METLPGLEIVRALSAPVRALAEGDGADPATPLMEVRFSPFGIWYEIDSFWEGTFVERTQQGAFTKTMQESRDTIKSLYDHGYDPQIGNKVLGTIEDLREDPDSAVGDVRLFDTSYVRDLLPGLTAGVYGSSMRMVVVKESWDDEPEVSDYNPHAWPERTITEVRLLEFGPVTFPASPTATAGIRSATDNYYERLRSRDPNKVDELTRARASRTPDLEAAGDATASDDEAARTNPDEPGETHSSGITFAERRARAYPHQIQKGTE
jgi:hypothetical protein